MDEFLQKLEPATTEKLTAWMDGNRFEVTDHAQAINQILKEYFTQQAQSGANQFIEQVVTQKSERRRRLGQ